MEGAALAQSSLTMAVTLRDISCRISNYRDGTQSAHLCPRKEDAWFSQNAMGTYNLKQNLSGPYLLDDVRNVILLRKDLHGILDEGKLVFIPKPVSGSAREEEEANYVVHFLLPTYDIGALYHNTSLKPIPGVKTEFLFARFAWTLFPLLTQFLNHGSDRRLIYAKASEQGRKRLVSAVETVNAGDCARLADPGQRSRSVSPRKRKAPNSGNDAGGVADSTTGDVGPDVSD